MTDYLFPFFEEHPVTSPYGWRDSGFHAGTDFGWNTDGPNAGPSFPVAASAPGTVVYAADEGEGGGRTVTLAHDDGGQSRYYHLDHWLVEVGQRVGYGDQIAWSGGSGGVAPHLHFELHDAAGNTYDPMTVLHWPEPVPPTPGPEPVPPDPGPEPVPPDTPPWPGVYLRNYTAGGGTGEWQAQMAARGWNLDVDDQYGAQSESVCRAFQTEKGLDVDGVVGPITWDAAWTAPVT